MGSDHISWTDNERWEIIDGIVHNMSPAPLRIHQELLVELSRQISNHLAGKSAKVYVFPFDVRFSPRNAADGEQFHVVHPDISVVNDLSKLDEKGCKGSPDLIVEILSAETAQIDIKNKFNLYEEFGVREYWIAYPAEKIIQVYRITADNRYGRPEIYSAGDKIKSEAVEGLVVELQSVFMS
jgi:Uma2 family endonuclease